MDGLVFTRANTAPTISNIADQTTNEDTPISAIGLTIGDAETPPGSLTVSGSSSNTTLVPNANLVFGGSGTNRTVTVTPAANQFGTATITVTVSDGLLTASDTFVLTVNAVNDAPTFTMGANQTVAEDAGAQTVVGWATNISKGPANESGQALNFLITNTNPSLFAVQPTISANGTLTYTPAPDAFGSATVGVKLQDNGGKDNGGVDISAEQAFTITVTPINDAPVANPDSATTNEDTAVAINVLANDTAGPPNESTQTLTITHLNGVAAVVGTRIATTQGWVVLNSNGTVTYIPGPNYNGSDSFNYTIQDSGDPPLSAGTTGTVTINPVNDDPVAHSQTVSTDEDTALTITLTGDDGDPEVAQALTFKVTSVPANGSLYVGSGTGGALISSASATSPYVLPAGTTQVTFAPNANYNGSSSFTFIVTDDNQAGPPANLTSAPATVSITVRPVNDAPVASNDGPYSVDEDVSLTVLAADGILRNDSDIDNALLYAELVGGPTSGTLTLNPDGSFTYTPAANFHGSDSFTYRAFDGTAYSNVATVAITVNPVNDAPTADAGGPYSGSEGSPISFTGSGADVDGDALTYSWDFGDGTSTAFSTSPNATHTYADNGTYAAKLTAKDSSGATGISSVGVIVANVAPTASIVSIGTPRVEGTAISVTGSATDPGTLDAPTYAWAVYKDGAATPFATGGNSSGFSFTPNDNGSYRIALTATDKDGASHAVDQTISVANVAPSVAAANAAVAVNEGQAASNTGTWSDPGADVVTLTASKGTVTKDANGTWSWSFNTTDGLADGATVTITATDSDNAVTTTTFSLVVANVAPSASIDNGGPINEGGSATVSLTGASDPSNADTTAGFRYSFARNTSGLATSYAGASANNSASLSFADNGSHPIFGRIFDKDGGYSDYQTTVTVNNVGPAVGAITAPIAPNAVNSVINVSASFTDPGVLDTHTATWYWGNGASSPATVSESNGSGTVTGSYSYTTAGVYTIRLVVTDRDGGSGESIFEYVVVYDPSAGFVTGGGWINSPAGAYAADPTLIGRANFGFVARYRPGATVPQGKTEFQFKLANLNFNSVDYDWLVVAGARAQYRGTGTINGSGAYNFMLTAIDGQRPGGGGADRFRMKIWGAGGVIYDNQMGAGDDAAPTTVLGGGSIVIHQSLLAAGGAALGGSNSRPLTDASLKPIVAEAIDQWAKAGASLESLAVLSKAQVRVTDLPDDLLGVEGAGMIWVDQDAAGHGWFLDTTPGDDSEFASGAFNSPARGRMDLLSVVAHEMGHLLGLGHDDGDDVMHEDLAAGVRHLPESPTAGSTAPIGIVTPTTRPVVAATFAPVVAPADTLPQPSAVVAIPTLGSARPRHQNLGRPAHHPARSNASRAIKVDAGHQDRSLAGSALHDMALEQVKVRGPKAGRRIQI